MVETLESWRWLLFVLLGAAALTDIRSFRIPNAIPLAVAVTALILLVIFRAPSDEFVAAAASGLIGLAVGYALFAIGWMGAGDGKLFAAAACWFAPAALLAAGLFVSLAGVAVSLSILGISSLRRMSAAQAQATTSALKTPVPYGVAIAVGFFLAAQLPMTL